eukprot:scaffold25694_cov127-Cylindrotheca_fusiformis.AAC.20
MTSRLSRKPRYLRLIVLVCALLGSIQVPLASTTAVAESTHIEAVNDEEATQRSREASTRSRMNLNDVLIKAGKRGLGGGVPGAVAGVVQVIALMWLRTIINYQCRYGTTFAQALQVLHREGGIGRFYQGVGFALIQAPLSKFVSTAANDGVEAFLLSFEYTRLWGVGQQTFFSSVFVGLWRMLLMPVDTCKVVLQVDGSEGFRQLIRRVKNGKIGVLYQGAVATAVSSTLANYPWFFVYNLLTKNDTVIKMFGSQLIRNGFVGLAASVASDTVVNSLRVIKTTKQSLGSKHNLSYLETIRMVLAADGWKGLFGRGLRTRILANALQSALFTIIWRGLAERWNMRATEQEDSSTEDDD